MTRSGHAMYTEPFHVALRTAIRERGLTLERLHVHLARSGVSVGVSSLSNWQTGQSRPQLPGSLRVLAALEDTLGLPPGSLFRLLAATGAGPERARRTGLADIAPVAELLDAVPGSRDRDVELISAHHKIVVDADRRTTWVWKRTAVRALRDGVDRYVGRYYGRPDCRPGLVQARALDNCRLGRFVPHASAPALVYELVFDEVLRAGDTWVFESELVDPTASASNEFAYGFRYPAEQYLLQVRFHPRARPAACWTFAQCDLSDERHRTASLPLSAHNTVHLVASPVSSGVLGIGWDWP